MLKKKITIDKGKKILAIARGDIEIVKEKYEGVKKTGYRNLTGFMMKAISEDWKMPKEFNKSMDIDTKFHNFERRTSNYSSEELDNMMLNRCKNITNTLSI